MFYANEATTTILALAQHGTGSPPRISLFDDYDFYLSYMDWFHFIHEQYEEHVHAKEARLHWTADDDVAAFVNFWDRISKYVWRTWEAVSQTKLRDHAFFSSIAHWKNKEKENEVGYTGLYDFSEVWKKMIRGKKQYTLEANFIKP